MANKFTQPESTDPVSGGLEGVKKRLASEDFDQKIVALSEAFNYGEAGLALVIEVLKEQSSPIQVFAHLLLKERADQQIEEALQQYYEEKIKYYVLEPERVINAVHELRLYLNGIIGFQKLILDGMASDPEEEREFLKEAQESVIHLLNLLNDILDIMQIETDQMPLGLGEVKLDEVFKDIEEFRILAQKKNLSLYLEMPNNHNEIILYSNSENLKKVISNLLNNAIKYTYEGEIKISAEVIKKKNNVSRGEFLHMVTIEVTDTGIGVPLNKQNNLFKPFFEPFFKNGVHHGGLSCYTRIGLKLTLSRSLVKRMGGEMNFYSPGEGLGSTVTFTIPMLGSL